MLFIAVVYKQIIPLRINGTFGNVNKLRFGDAQAFGAFCNIFFLIYLQVQLVHL